MLIECASSELSLGGRREPGWRTVSLHEKVLEMHGDGLHATPAVLGLGVGIVIGVRVDVVGVGAAMRVLDELDPRDTDVVRGQVGLPGRNKRVLEAWHDLELVARRDSSRPHWLLN